MSIFNEEIVTPFFFHILYELETSQTSNLFSLYSNKNNHVGVLMKPNMK